MNISIWSITYQHYDEIINQSLNNCIIWGGGGPGVGRIYSIQGGGGQIGGKGYCQNSGGSWLKGGRSKIQGGLEFGPWMKLCFGTHYDVKS